LRKETVTTAAVIATTYNRPDALRAVLEGLMCQDRRGFEVLIADDGSTEDTRQLVEQYARRADFTLRHVWQEDLGFRPGAARNRALAATNAEYVIFIDGDCVPPPDFVSRHLTLAEPGFFLGGNRVLLTEAFTRRALAEQLPLHNWGNAAWLLAWLRRDINRLLPLLRLPDGAFRRSHPDQWEGIKSCNLSAWRADLQRVNGFDEAYSGWGLEDSDLVIRMINAGIKHKSARFATPLFHLWHRESDRSQLPENQQRLDALLASPRTEATRGLNQYS
jgi:glycosyltransferase involved in cell wall biosynthesis